MQLKYSKIKAQESRNAEVKIYGGIGDKIDGDYLAQEIAWLDKESDVITIRINSLGGSWVQALSIISAIIACKSLVIAIIEGVACSSSAVISFSCKQVKMNDFARAMLHSPYFKDDEGNRTNDLNDDDRNAISQMRGMMVDILTRRGKKPDEILKILETDTWYNAKEAKDAGFIDEIIPTGVIQETAALSIDKLAAYANDHFNPQHSMKKIAAKLGLPEDSTEEAILAALSQKETGDTDVRKKLIDAVIATGKKSGVINDANEAKMRKLAETDMELFADLVITPSAPADNTRLSDLVSKALERLGEHTKTDDKTWAWYQENDSEALAEMKVKEPEKFKTLYKEYWKQDYQEKK